ncbi:MAG: hypothetical protein WC770_02485, partial [Phycisphaerae bacterium]
MFTKTLSGALLLVALFSTFTLDANAKSIYAIIDHGYMSGPPAKIASYDVNSSQINWQATLELADQQEYPTGMGLGPVGIAIDSNSGYLFISHESMYYYCGCTIKGIQLIEASTMTDLGWISAPNAVDVAGIVFDNEKGKLYVADRSFTGDNKKVFVYSWNADNMTLSYDRELLITDQSGQGELYDLSACGLALDETEDLLYVTFISDHWAATNKVYCYNTEDWTFQKRIEITVDGNDRYATAAAIYNNGSSKYLFTGAFWNNTYLVRTDLSDTNNPDSYVEKNLGTGIGATGIAVDQQTGLVYVTTSYDNTIKVFNGLNFPSDPCYTETANISGPAGICVPYASPIDVDIAITDNVSDCVFPNNDVNYTVEYAINQD